MVALSWRAAEWVGYAAAGAVVVLGLAAYWVLVDKSDRPQPFPMRFLLPMVVAFVAGIYFAGYMAEADDELLPAGYAVWFMLWLQFGLWLKRRHDTRASASPAANAESARSA